MITLPRLPLNPTPEQIQYYWQLAMEAIEAALTAQEEFLQNVIDLNDLVTDANTAIAAANTAATNAQAAADETAAATALTNSYVTGLTLSATDAGANATITISAHTRVYPQADGTNLNVAVNGGSVTGLLYSTEYRIYYDDPTRAGGAVTYNATTSATTAAQTGNRHSVGAILTPAALAAPSSGRGTPPPGYVEA